jgi:hypothetical protein
MLRFAGGRHFRVRFEQFQGLAARFPSRRNSQPPFRFERLAGVCVFGRDSIFTMRWASYSATLSLRQMRSICRRLAMGLIRRANTRCNLLLSNRLGYEGRRGGVGWPGLSLVFIRGFLTDLEAKRRAGAVFDTDSWRRLFDLSGRAVRGRRRREPGFGRRAREPGIRQAIDPMVRPRNCARRKSPNRFRA